MWHWQLQYDNFIAGFVFFLSPLIIYCFTFRFIYVSHKVSLSQIFFITQQSFPFWVLVMLTLLLYWSKQSLRTHLSVLSTDTSVCPLQRHICITSSILLVSESQWTLYRWSIIWFPLSNEKYCSAAFVFESYPTWVSFLWHNFWLLI